MIEKYNNNLGYNPRNEHIKKKLEADMLHGLHRDAKTVREVWRNINMLEAFTNNEDFILFNKERAIEYKDWLATRENKKGDLLSLSSIKTILHNTRTFFDWLIRQKGYRLKLDGNISTYLHLSNNENRAARATKEKPIATFKELEKALLAMPFATNVEKRNRAMFACMIVSCVRVKALISLKVKDFDSVTKILWQDPKHVQTKFRKGIETRLVGVIMPIAEEIFIEWMNYIKDELQFKGDYPIFPKTQRGEPFMPLELQNLGLTREHWSTSQPVREIFKAAFEFVELPYYNPHSFRKTLGTWMIKNCTPMEIKAISQNLGHEHVDTTFNSYTKMTTEEQRKSIEGIGDIKVDFKSMSKEDIMAVLKMALNMK